MVQVTSHNVPTAGGAFLTPRNLWTLLVQTSSIAVMATGMVLVIVLAILLPIFDLQASVG